MINSEAKFPATGHKKWLVLFLFSLALISANAYNAYLHYDFPISADDENYFKMAQGDYAVDVTHRYRVVIPILARAVALPISKMYRQLWPHRPESNWPLRLGFLLVNSFIMALSGVFIFLLCEAYGARFLPSLLAVIAILTSRWATYFAGTASTDSLYFVTILLVMLGIRSQNTAKLVVAIFIGPFGKESFIFISPLILFSSHISKSRQIVLFTLSGLLVFSVRYLIDAQVGTPYFASINNAFAHIENIRATLVRLLSPGGFFEVFSVLGLYFVIIVVGVTGGKDALKGWYQKIDAPLIALFFIILLHVLLSTQIARMLFFAAPAWAVAMALILNQHPRFAFLAK